MVTLKMIGSLRGKLLRKRPAELLIEVGGVGYTVAVPLSISVAGEGQEVFLYTYTHVREDSLQLYGFLKEEDKQVFTKVLSVSGIGPRLALAIVSGISVDKFRLAVEREDVSLLSRIPGIGKKTANRLILELKGKLPDSEAPVDVRYDDAYSALVNLGYRKSNVTSTLDALSRKGITDIETILRESLKILSEGDKG
ncbi:MAG: Holliday junction branch migration protein RuvA [Nitrospirae bacterium]|nr:Holliday junction branch migration protein RuvA [Nitrospirota bacterium]